MANFTIEIEYREDSVLVDPDTVVLSDPLAAFGVKTDSGTVVVAAGVPMVKESVGLYSYEVTGIDLTLLYSYVVKYEIAGVPSYYTGEFGGLPPEPTDPQLIATANSPFTSRTLVENYLGEEGVDLLTDDLATTTIMTTEITRAIDESTDYILMYLLERYTADQLRRSTWVQRRATELACFFLFQRRGQQPPTGLAESFMRITDELERISKNIKMLVPGANPRESQGPALSNYVVDDMQLAHRLRVDTIDSVNEGGYTGRRDYVDLGGIAPL